VARRLSTQQKGKGTDVHLLLPLDAVLGIKLYVAMNADEMLELTPVKMVGRERSFR